MIFCDFLFHKISSNVLKKKFAPQFFFNTFDKLTFLHRGQAAADTGVAADTDLIKRGGALGVGEDFGYGDTVKNKTDFVVDVLLGFR